MIRFVNLYIALIMSVLCFSCDSMIVEIPAEKLKVAEPKIVVASFICPQDTVIQVAVTKSISSLGVVNTTSTQSINGAKVSISNGTKTEQLSYNSKLTVYEISQKKMKVEAGKTYKLIVSLEGKSVEATCTVPKNPASIKSFVIDSTYDEKKYPNGTTYFATLSWDDIPNEKNFYRVRISLEDKWEIPTLSNSSPKQVVYIKTNISQSFNWENVGDLYTDKNAENATITSLKARSATMSYPSITFEGKTYNSRRLSGAKIVSVELKTTDESYYQYHRSIRQNRSDGDDIPLAFAEPTTVYTNVTGGLGCFAAYNRSVFRVLR